MTCLFIYFSTNTKEPDCFFQPFIFAFFGWFQTKSRYLQMDISRTKGKDTGTTRVVNDDVSLR